MSENNFLSIHPTCGSVKAHSSIIAHINAVKENWSAERIGYCTTSYLKLSSCRPWNLKLLRSRSSTHGPLAGWQPHLAPPRITQILLMPHTTHPHHFLVHHAQGCFNHSQSPKTRSVALNPLPRPHRQKRSIESYIDSIQLCIIIFRPRGRFQGVVRWK